MKRVIKLVLVAVLVVLKVGTAQAQSIPSQTLLCQVWGQQTLSRFNYIGQHSKSEMLFINGDGSLSFEGVISYQAGTKPNTVNQWNGTGYLKPGPQADEFYLHLNYHQLATTSCGVPPVPGGEFSCVWGPWWKSQHQEEHVCFGNLTQRLVCSQIEAFDPPLKIQVPAETTVCTPLSN